MAPQSDQRPTRVGSPLRDAAVDSRPGDFLAPINAGKDDPHGPNVVAPGIHAVGPAPIRPGPVAVDDPAQQDRDEKEIAEETLIHNRSVPEVVAEIAAESPPEASRPNEPVRTARAPRRVAEGGE